MRSLRTHDELRTTLELARAMLVVGPAMFWSARGATAQCMYWEALPPLPSSISYVYDTCVFPSGSTNQLCIAVDDLVCIWNGSWAGVQGFDDIVTAVAEFDDGTGPALYAGGNFQFDGSQIVSLFHIARRVGANWVQVGSFGMPVMPSPYFAYPYAMVPFAAGGTTKLYVGGDLPAHPSIGAAGNGLLSWDGATWSAVGTGLAPIPGQPRPIVQSMCVFDDGSGPALFVAGQFSAAGGTPANGLAKWDGSGWKPFSAGFQLQGTPGIPSLDVLQVWDSGSGPTLYAGGYFNASGTTPLSSFARWTGSSWGSPAGIQLTTPPGRVSAIAVHDDGTGAALFLGGATWINSNWAATARWDGQALSSLGDGCWYPSALESFDDGMGGGPALYSGGSNTPHCGGNLAYPDLARWYGGCTHPIDPLCFGDGSFAACPCANYGAPQHGCANSSTSQGALLGASGSTIPDTLVLHSSGELASSLSIFVQGDAPRPVQIPFGDGILCVGGTLLRLYVKLASGGSAQAPAAGDLSISQRSAGLGHPIAAGTARYYQVWYRDGAAGFCTPNSFNVSNALRVGW